MNPNRIVLAVGAAALLGRAPRASKVPHMVMRQFASVESQRKRLCYVVLFVGRNDLKVCMHHFEPIAFDEHLPTINFGSLLGRQTIPAHIHHYIHCYSLRYQR